MLHSHAVLAEENATRWMLNAGQGLVKEAPSCWVFNSCEWFATAAASRWVLMQLIRVQSRGEEIERPAVMPKLAWDDGDHPCREAAPQWVLIRAVSARVVMLLGRGKRVALGLERRPVERRGSRVGLNVELMQVVWHVSPIAPGVDQIAIARPSPSIGAPSAGGSRASGR